MSDLRDAQRLDQALGTAYRFIAKRDRTISEVQARLAKDGVDEATIEAAIAELTALNYLDDTRYARRFAEDRRNLDAWGDERIERRLRELGIERETVVDALSSRREGRSELDTALQLLRRRFPRPPQTPRERNRALGMLARKGYDSELAHDAIRAHCAPVP